MQFSTLLLAIFASSVIGAAVPRAPSNDVMRRGPEVEAQGASGNDDDDAIAYAWFSEDEEPSN
ncbi:hypothetical protein GGS21DRAFT_486917 [Xylaria nigripes]|nr:hypothetical protein GGS21DRAFT_486917 [Xylaria nigripes]